MQNAVAASATGPEAADQNGMSTRAISAAKASSCRRPIFCDKAPPLRQPRIAPIL